MSRRGKDDGFHPHPGDPWHPGWSSDDEPVIPEQDLPAGPDLPAPDEPGPGALAPRDEGQEGVFAPTLFDVGEGASTVPEDGTGSTDLPAVAAEPVEPGPGEDHEAEEVREGAEEEARQEPAGSAAEGEIPPEDGDVEEWLAFAAGSAREVAGQETEMETVATPGQDEAAREEEERATGGRRGRRWWPLGHRGVPEETRGGPEEPESPPAAEWPEEPLPPPWSPDLGWEEDRAVPIPVVAGPPPGEEPESEGEEPGPVEEMWPQKEEVAESAGEPVPPPWVPQADLDRAVAVPVVAGPPPGEEPESEEAEAGGPSWEESADEPVPPPWVPQADLDRAVAVPVVPGPPPGEEPESEDPEAAGSIDGEWSEEESPEEEWPEEEWPEEEWPEEPAGTGARGEEAAEDWSVPGEPLPAAPRLDETGRYEPAAGPSAEEEAEEEAWAEFAGWEAPEVARPRPEESGEPSPAPPTAPGAPTVELPAPALFDFARPAAPGDRLGGEMFAGAVTAEHRHLAEEVAAADTAEAQLQALSAPMPGLESGVVGFEDVVHLGAGEEMAEPTRSDLPVRVVTGLVLAGILLGSLWVGGELLAALVGVLALLALAEFYGTLRHTGYAPLAVFGFLGAIGLLVGTWFLGLVAIPVAAIGLIVVCFFYYSFVPRRREPFTNGSLTLLGALWIPGTLAFAFPIAAAPNFRVLILAAAATVVATDVGAFFAGRSWGSRPLAPVLSPNKTVEGLAGGVVLGIAASVVIGHFLEPLSIRTGAALGLVVAVMAPLGDLAESMLKRSLGVKDMGSILPGHGGVLDRVDAFLFVLPAVWVLYETLGLLR